ncbi:MAG: hypothetical protein Q4C96_10910 [Planctomycetia bacterium]|nr:hypothetical protein [Planctomycetia bacterium]
MKRTWIHSVMSAVILASGLCGYASAETSSAIRSESEQAFVQLTSNALEAVNKIQKDKESGAKGVTEVKFQIAEVQAPGQTVTTTAVTNASGQTTTNTQTTVTSTPSKLGIKVWFELTDGTLVNPTKREWKPREKFYIHIQSAVPVYVGLYQNYPESRPTSRQIYPDKKYPESFKAIQPGQATKLPVLFEMDDDMRDEIMSMVVVRSDWEGIQNGLTAQATASVTNTNGTAQVTAQVTATGAGTIKSINDAVVTKKEITKDTVKENAEGVSEKEAENITKSINEAAGGAKFQIVGSEVATSTQANDVCFYMFGTGSIGQWQLTIKK